ncbi:MAG TPA: ribulose-phosphate 3-epimerase [Atopostipes sp.]|nr:ribulose-phosphate 3-epimerase [Atopostipes sp.]
MGKIAPSILSADISKLGEDIQMLDKGGADWIHIDVMDGHFVPNLTFGPNVVAAAKNYTDLPLDVHLMVEEPEKMINGFAEAGATGISIHAEATKNIHQVMQHIRSLNVQAGVVINPGTAVSFIEPVLSIVDMVLVMTVNPGFGGQSFIPETLKKIEKLDAYRKENDLSYLIQVDGGVNEETIQLCHEAGADVFVAGSNVFGAKSPADQIQKLKHLVN